MQCINGFVATPTQIHLALRFCDLGPTKRGLKNDRTHETTRPFDSRCGDDLVSYLDVELRSCGQRKFDANAAAVSRFRCARRAVFSRPISAGE